eukprot:TRINITY_DN1954_c0_g1_i1.p1 TRINITY_DN1954_c0_g1~~TRINITY_DN1954_c0_g1_i1.p1  ORF type:complete len:370 (+),score=50.15 TRINITY_DN1954_c0_g1_i1:33-1112(+)
MAVGCGCVGGVLGVAVLVLACYVGWVYQLEDPRLAHIPRTTPEPITLETSEYQLTTVRFPCSGLSCEAFLYNPNREEGDKRPALIMAHGLGSQKDFGLAKFASVFSARGYVVFVFDYRNFGGSDGDTFNEISPTMQLEDWESAIQFVATLKEVDASKICLWGTSFSGGHVLVTAAKTAHSEKIKAVISQVPFLKAFSSTIATASSATITDMLKLSLLGLVDKTRALMGLSRLYIPIYGECSDSAILCAPSFKEGYPRLVPKDPRGGWQNQCPASIALSLLLYNPHTFARDVKAPTLIVYDIQDELCLPDDVKDVSKQIPDVHLYELSSGHFSVYEELFEETIHAELSFLQKHLPISPSP